jgi:Double zinc ribbon
LASAKTLICASCGSEEPEGSGFCGSCGAPLEAAADAQPDHPESIEASPPSEVMAPAPVAANRLASAKTLICASCGSEEPEGSGFCGSCGAPLAAAADAQPDHPESIEASPPSEVMVPEGTEAPTEIAPSLALPQAPPSDPAPPPPAEAVPPARPRRRVRTSALIAAFLVLIAAGAAAALFGTGVIGGNSTKSESSFVLQLNEKVLGPLGQADATAAEHASTTGDVTGRTVDGSRIVEVAAEASGYLRALSALSGQEKGEVQLLLAFVAANGRYGQAFAAFEPTKGQSQLALAGAVAAARAARATVQSGLPADLQLPSQATFISLRVASPPPPSSTTNATPSASGVAVAYVQQVDDLLSRSHAVVLALRAFIPRATSDAISRSDAAAAARSYLDQRSIELKQAQALTVPPTFALAQGLLIRSLEASVADDQALVAWAVARRDGSGNAQAAFDQTNRIGAQATALKQQFLRVYGQQRQTATGRNPAGLPDIF